MTDRSKGRFVWPLVTGVIGLLLGIAVAIGGDGGGPAKRCADLATEAIGLVTEGLDAGLSGDEGRMLDVADRRDQVERNLKNYC